MGDMGETFLMMREMRRKRHSEQKGENTEALLASGVLFRAVNDGEALLFRERGRPAVDFYPSTGRWKCEGRLYRGGAQIFLKWYSSRGESTST